MKKLLLVLGLCSLSIPAFAGTHYAYASFKPDARGQAVCEDLASTLRGLSSPELRVRVTANCKLEHAHPVGHVLSNILLGVGTWGVYTVDCAVQPRDCRDKTHYQLGTEVSPRVEGRAMTSSSVAYASAMECASAARALEALPFTISRYHFKASCDDQNVLTATFIKTSR